jgi:adenylylsulfate reductase subunit B
MAPITTVPWGSGQPELRDVPAPTQDQRDSQHLWSEPEMIRMDDGDVHTLKSNGLKMKLGVSY